MLSLLATRVEVSYQWSTQYVDSPDPQNRSRILFCVLVLFDKCLSRRVDSCRVHVVSADTPADEEILHGFNAVLKAAEKMCGPPLLKKWWEVAYEPEFALAEDRLLRSRSFEHQFTHKATF